MTARGHDSKTARQQGKGCCAPFPRHQAIIPSRASCHPGYHGSSHHAIRPSKKPRRAPCCHDISDSMTSREKPWRGPRRDFRNCLRNQTHWIQTAAQTPDATAKGPSGETTEGEDPLHPPLRNTLRGPRRKTTALNAMRLRRRVEWGTLAAGLAGKRPRSMPCVFAGE